MTDVRSKLNPLLAPLAAVRSLRMKRLVPLCLVVGALSCSAKVGEPAECAAAADSITRLVTAPACTAVVRLDYQSLAPKGWNVRCGPATTPTERAAKASLAPHVSFPPFDSYEPQPSADPFPFAFGSFWGDWFGFGLVSRQTGFVAFAGTTVHMGPGDISFPKEWRDAAELAGSCTAQPLPPVETLGTGAETKDAGAAALAVVFSTALPRALSTSGRLRDVVVLAYARTVGMFDPTTAEWIVIVESAP